MAETDWFDALDKELEKRTEEIIHDVGEYNSQKVEVSKNLISDFWRLWIRFNKEGIHFTMEPSHSAFAHFTEFPDDWEFKPKFNFSAVNTMSLTDRTQDRGRVGDSLKAWYYNRNSTTRMRVVFEYCEGEHYYKYSGWKRIFTQQVLYDQALSKVSFNSIHNILGELIKEWYESHLRRNREMLIKYVRDNFEKGETFTQ